MENFFKYIDELYRIDFDITEVVVGSKSSYFGFNCLPENLNGKKINVLDLKKFNPIETDYRIKIHSLQRKALDDFTRAKNKDKKSILDRTDLVKRQITEAYNTYFLISDEFDKNKSHDYIIGLIYYHFESIMKMPQKKK